MGELAAQFGCELIGDPAVSVSGVATLANAGDGDLSFFANRNYRRDLQSTRASVVVTCARDADECPVAVLISDDPYMIYARVAHLLHPEPAVTAGVHESACIAASAKLANGVHVSANASICEDTVIGENVVIGPGAVIGPRCWIGDDTKILANVTLVRDTTLGKRCIVHSGAVLGGDGFGNAIYQLHKIRTVWDVIAIGPPVFAWGCAVGMSGGDKYLVRTNLCALGGQRLGTVDIISPNETVVHDHNRQPRFAIITNNGPSV